MNHYSFDISRREGNTAISNEYTLASLKDHIPFSIGNNSEMASYASSDAWNGSGVFGDPYIIEFYNFSTTENAISISNVSHYFVIGNCSFETPSPGVGIGVNVSETPNGKIMDCNFTNLESGIILDDVSGFQVSRNLIEVSNFGILLQNSRDCIITDNEIERGITIYGDEIENWRHQISSNLIEDVPLGYFYQHSGVLDGGIYGQIILAESSDVILKSGVDEDARAHTAIQLGFCTDVLIDEVNMFWAEIGLYSQSTNHTIVDSCSAAVNSKHGFMLENSNNWNFYQTRMSSNGGIGLLGTNSHNLTLDDCYLYVNEGAISLSNSQDAKITDCDIYDCEFGVNISNGGFHQISFNSIHNNTNTGLAIKGSSSNCSIWGNEISWNGINAWDDTGNIWDNGVFMGNSWTNYTGSGNYDVSGVGGGIDHYPINYHNYTGQIELALPPILSYQEGTTGNELELYILSETHYDFEILEGGIGRGGGGNHDWPYQHFSIDGYTEGFYEFSVIAQDRLGNDATATVTLEVTAPPIIDFTAPTIESPGDPVVTMKGLDMNITWILYDEHPWYYFVFVNDSLIEEDSWEYGGQSVTINLIEWDIGTYLVRIKASDAVGHNTTSEILVIIVPLFLVDNPQDITYVEHNIGNNITWSILVGNPERFEIYKDGIEYTSGVIDSDFIVCFVDNLSIGTYNFTLYLYQDAFWISDNVIVHVVSTTAPPWQFDTPLEILSLAIAAGSVTIVAIILVRIYKSRERGYDLISG